MPRQLIRLVACALAAFVISSCAGVGDGRKPHVYPGTERGVNPKPWNQPDEVFEGGSTSGFPQSR